MLADDEGIVIDSLQFILKKEFGDQCVVESAKTGRSVIELAESFRPDIAIMDIQMPGINGIEAMREIRQTNASTIFIVMTAYDKFDYAKEAINLGVLEYMNKPIDRVKIAEVVRRAMRQIDREREKRSNDLMIREKLETVIPVLESGFIYEILLREHFAEDIESYRNMLGITQNYAYMMTVVYGDSQEGNHMTNAVGSSVRMQQYYQGVRAELKERFNCIVGSIMANKIAVLVPFEKPVMEYAQRSEIIEKAREFVRDMRKRYSISFRVGISKVNELDKLSNAYNEAINSLIITAGSVAHADDLPIGCGYEEDYPLHIEKQLFEELEKGNLDHTIDSAKNFFDWMISAHADGIMDIRLKCLEFVLWAEHIAYEKGGMTYQFKSRNDYLTTIMNISDYDQMKDWFVDKVANACRNITSRKEESSNNVVDIAKEYIKNNYSKPLSLDEVSYMVNISPYYFSKIFKEGTGENFIEYLTNIRIEKAKELLSNSDYSMKEICVMVGYSDPNYFSRSFKKNVGVTPTEYKELENR
jgi:two-component system response regulator YesN